MIELNNSDTINGIIDKISFEIDFETRINKEQKKNIIDSLEKLRKEISDIEDEITSVVNSLEYIRGSI